MVKHLVTALLMTAVTTVLLGVAYPLAVTGLAHTTQSEPGAAPGHGGIK